MGKHTRIIKSIIFVGAFFSIFLFYFPKSKNVSAQDDIPLCNDFVNNSTLYVREGEQCIINAFHAHYQSAKIDGEVIVKMKRQGEETKRVITVSGDLELNGKITIASPYSTTEWHYWNERLYAQEFSLIVGGRIYSNKCSEITKKGVYVNDHYLRHTTNIYIEAEEDISLCKISSFGSEITSDSGSYARAGDIIITSNNGDVNISGSGYVSSSASGNYANIPGNIEISAENGKITINGVIDSSGKGNAGGQNGGRIKISGKEIELNGQVSSSGGYGYTYDGGDGGSIEISGSERVTINGRVSSAGGGGDSGGWGGDITISSFGKVEINNSVESIGGHGKKIFYYGGGGTITINGGDILVKSEIKSLPRDGKVQINGENVQIDGKINVEGDLLNDGGTIKITGKKSVKINSTLTANAYQGILIGIASAGSKGGEIKIEGEDIKINNATIQAKGGPGNDSPNGGPGGTVTIKAKTVISKNSSVDVSHGWQCGTHGRVYLSYNFILGSLISYPASAFYGKDDCKLGSSEDIGSSFRKTGKRPIEEDGETGYTGDGVLIISEGGSYELGDKNDYVFGEEERKNSLNTDDILEEGKDVSYTTFYYRYPRLVMVVEEKKREECHVDANGNEVCEIKYWYEKIGCEEDWQFTYKWFLATPDDVAFVKKQPQDADVSDSLITPSRNEYTIPYTVKDLTWRVGGETFTCYASEIGKESGKIYYRTPFMYYPGMQDNENNFPGNFDNFISEAGYYWRGANLFADEGIGRPWDPGEISAGTKINIIGTQEKENSKYKLPIYKYSWNKVLGWIDSLRGPDRYIIEFFNTQKGSGEYTKEIVKDYLDRFPLNEYPMKSTLPLYGEKAKYDSGKGHWEQGTLVDIKSEDECKNEANYILFNPLSNKKCEDFIPTKVDPKYEIRDFTQVNYKNAFKNNLESLEDLYLFYNASNISLDTNDFVYDFYDYLNTVEYYYNRYLPIIKVDFNKKYRGILYPPINDNENYQKMTQCLLKSGTYTDINVSYGYKTGETYNYGEQKIFTSIAPEPKYPFDPDFELLRLGPNVNWVLNYSEIYPESIYGDDLERKKLHQILKEYYANVNLTKWYDESGKEIRLDDAIENNINQLYSTYPVLFEWCPVDYPADYKDNSKGYLKAESYYLKFWHDDFWKEKYSKSEDSWIKRKRTDTNPKWEKYCPYSDLYAIDPTSPACLVNLQGQILGDYHGAVVNKTTYPPPLLKGEVKLTPTTFKTVEPYFRTTLQSFTSNVLYKWSIATCLRDDGIACQLTNNGKPDEKARVKPLTKQEEALGYYYGAEMGQDWIFVGEAEFIERGFITPKKSPTLVNVDTVVKWNPILGYRAYAVELVDVTNGTPGKFAGLAVVTSNEITIGDLWLTKEGYSKPILKPNRTYYLNLYVCSKNPLESPEFTGEHQNYPNNPSLLYKTDSTGLSEIKGAIEESCVNKSTITLITSGAQVKSEKVKVPENIPDKIVITERPNHFDKTPESLVNDYRQGIASYYVEIKEEATGNVFHKIILDPLYNLDYSNPEVTLDYPEIKPGKEYSLTIRTCADRFPDIKDPETIPQERIKAFCGPETSKSFKISELKPPEITYPVNGDKAQVGFNIKWNAPRDSVTPRYYKYEFKYKSKSDDEVSQSCVDKIGSVIKSGIVTHKGTENDAQTDIYCLGDYTLTMYSCIEDKCTDEFISTPVSVNFTLIPSKVSENIFSITPCGRKTDNPKTNWIDEREPCKLVHMFLLVKITFDFLITRFMLIVAVLMVVGIFAANYIIRIPALTHQAITGFKYVLIGYGVAIFGWIIITTIINLLGMKVPLFSIGF